jgi:hypothetical protein
VKKMKNQRKKRNKEEEAEAFASLFSDETPVPDEGKEESEE